MCTYHMTVTAHGIPKLKQQWRKSLTFGMTFPGPRRPLGH